jgi:hypothetical protein
VFREVSDPGGEKGDLYLARSGILVMGTVFFDYVLFVYLFGHDFLKFLDTWDSRMQIRISA